MRDIGQEIRRLRNLKQLDLRELSRVSGVSYQQISRIENGLADARMTSLTALLNALGYDLQFTPAEAANTVKKKESVVS